MREVKTMKKTPLSSNYMFVVKRVNLVLLVNGQKLLLGGIYVAFNFFFSYLTPCLMILQCKCSKIR